MNACIVASHLLFLTKQASHDKLITISPKAQFIDARANSFRGWTKGDVKKHSWSLSKDEIYSILILLKSRSKQISSDDFSRSQICMILQSNLGEVVIDCYGGISVRGKYFRVSRKKLLSVNRNLLIKRGRYVLPDVR
jgi:hypothetical protein